ncbi:hypothetical protein BKA08_003544 [Nocardioides marinisabuli]|uniref:Uncharacterized protein n=1 Tax=Nocardioides marinisabuli TaxID=419476 RepID=A0A7Y9F4L4_9ACTN|nr:hypothetical protein [Nocardioides marinisabuli]
MLWTVLALLVLVPLAAWAGIRILRDPHRK